MTTTAEEKGSTAPRSRAAAAAKPQSSNLSASLCLLAAIVAFSAMTLTIKILGARLPVVEILFIRQAIMQCVILPVILRARFNPFATRRVGLQALRAALQMGAMLTSFSAMLHLPLPHAMAISFSSAVFVTIAAATVIGERVQADRWIAVTLGLCGVAVMLRPSSAASAAWSMLAVAGAMLAAAAVVTLRIHAEDRRPETVLSYQALIILGTLAGPTAAFWAPPTGHEALLLVIVGLSGTIGQYLLTVAYQSGDANALAPLDFVRLILISLGGWLMFGEGFDLWSGVGAALLVASTGYTVWRNAR